jgi:hypothetical protein
MSNVCACSMRLEICRHSQTFASPGYSPNGLLHTACSLADVTESAVANKVTSIPFFTRASVNTEATCSHGPYFLGGVLQVMGDSIATFTQIVLNVHGYSSSAEDTTTCEIQYARVLSAPWLKLMPSACSPSAHPPVASSYKDWLRSFSPVNHW